VLKIAHCCTMEPLAARDSSAAAIIYAALTGCRRSLHRSHVRDQGLKEDRHQTSFAISRERLSVRFIPFRELTPIIGPSRTIDTAHPICLGFIRTPTARFIAALQASTDRVTRRLSSPIQFPFIVAPAAPSNPRLGSISPKWGVVCPLFQGETPCLNTSIFIRKALAI